MAGLINAGILQPQLANSLAAGYQQAEERRNLLAQQQQQRQLADIQLQNALTQQRQASEEEAAYRAAGSDLNKLQAELFNRGLGKAGMAVGAQLSKQQADRLTALKTTTELMKSAATGIMANPTLENAIGTLQSFGQRTGANVSGELDTLMKMGDNPEAIKQWAAGHAVSADKLLPNFQHFDQGGAVVMGQVDPITGNFVQTGAVKKSMAPGVAERLDLEGQRVRQEGQRIGLEGRRVAVLEANAKRDSDPEFQQRMATARATGEAIAKGDVAATQALPKIINRAEQGIQLIDELIGKRDAKGRLIEGSKPHPGFENAVGATWLPGARFVPGTDAAGFMSRFDQVKGASFLEAFESLKGGGAITEKEGQKGTDAINRMSTSTDEKEFIRAALDLQDVIRKGVENAQKRASRAGGTSAANPSNIDALLDKYK